MTADEWLTCTDPQAMLAAIPKPSKRKLRLWVEACREAEARINPRVNYPDMGLNLDTSLHIAVDSWTRHEDALIPSLAHRADLLREIFGNPFRSKECPKCKGTSGEAIRGTITILGGTPKDCKRCHNTGLIHDPITVPPHWLTSNVAGLAQTIFEENAWDRMRFLGDALQDADCCESEILEHCYGENKHVRGCFLVDLLTGRLAISRIVNGLTWSETASDTGFIDGDGI